MMYPLTAWNHLKLLKIPSRDHPDVIEFGDRIGVKGADIIPRRIALLTLPKKVQKMVDEVSRRFIHRFLVQIDQSVTTVGMSNSESTFDDLLCLSHLRSFPIRSRSFVCNVPATAFCYAEQQDMPLYTCFLPSCCVRASACPTTTSSLEDRGSFCLIIYICSATEVFACSIFVFQLKKTNMSKHHEKVVKLVGE